MPGPGWRTTNGGDLDPVGPRPGHAPAVANGGAHRGGGPRGHGRGGGGRVPGRDRRGWLARRPAAVVPSGLPAADHAGPGDAGPRTDTRAWQCPPSWPRRPPWWVGAWLGLTCMWSGLPPTSDGAFIIAVTQPAADRADCHPRHRPDLAARAARGPQAARFVPPSWDAPCKPAALPITTFPGCVIRHGTSSGRPRRDLVRAMSAKEVSWCPEPPAEWCNPAW